MNHCPRDWEHNNKSIIKQLTHKLQITKGHLEDRKERSYTEAWDTGVGRSGVSVGVCAQPQDTKLLREGAVGSQEADVMQGPKGAARHFPGLMSNLSEASRLTSHLWSGCHSNGIQPHLRCHRVKNGTNQGWCKLVQPLQNTLWRFLNELKMDLPYESVSLPGIRAKEMKAGYQRHLHPLIHCSITLNSQDIKTTSVSIRRWMDKEKTVSAHSRTLLSHLWQHGWTLEALCSVKKARQRKSNDNITFICGTTTTKSNIKLRETE